MAIKVHSIIIHESLF